MFVRKQIFFSVISALLCAALMFIAWQAGKQNEYAGMAMSINLVVAYLLAILLGLFAIISRPYKSAVGFFNFIGTYNLFVTIAGSIFIFIDNDHAFSPVHLVFLLPLVIALFVLEHAYFAETEV